MILSTNIQERERKIVVSADTPSDCTQFYFIEASVKLTLIWPTEINACYSLFFETIQNDIGFPYNLTSAAHLP